MHIVRTIHALLAHISLNSPPSPPNSNHSSSQPSPTNFNNPLSILNDTSLAAIMLGNDERHLFFQDNEGAIRQAIHTTLSSSWDTSPHLNVTSNAKYHTPMTATAMNNQVLFRTQIFGRLPCVLTLKSQCSSTSRTTTPLILVHTTACNGLLALILGSRLQHPIPDNYPLLPLEIAAI